MANSAAHSEPSEPEDENKLRYRRILACAKENLENASRLLRRKIPCTGHLMTPRRLWIQTIPTQECDVVVMFPGGAQDVTLMWLLSRLRAGTPGLVVHVRHHASSDSYGFYLTAPFHVLLKAAEEVHLPKTLRCEFGGGLKEFSQQDADHFEGIHDERTFFTTQERQWLVLHLLETLRASKGDQVGGLRFIEGQAIVPKCVSAGVISQVFPLHEIPALEKLQKTWVWAFFHKQPLDAICSYFGVKITMYFAWLGHYTTALLVPSIVGIFIWLCFCGGDQATEDAGYVLFSLFNVLWASIYVEAWKRYSAELAYRWGTLDQRDELLIEPRPLFSGWTGGTRRPFWSSTPLLARRVWEGTLELSPVTGRLEPTYPAWKRYVFRYLVSVPVILLCLAVVFIVMIFTLQLQEWWDRQIDSRGYFFCLSYLPKILLAIVITLLDEAYYKVACWLNDKACFFVQPENYRLDTKYENHLIVKVALFQFVNSFLSLFYIAFYLQDQEKLKEQLAALLIARQVIGNLKESALPYLLEQLRIAKLSFDLFGALSPTEAKKVFVPHDDKKNEDQEKTNQPTTPQNTTPTTTTPGSNRNVSQAELESALYKYDGTFADHLEMFIQLGYVVLFSSAFPMAAFCALINNMIEIRSDAFKLCFIFQRPFGQRVSSIGTWQNAMEVMGLIAVLVNCALIGLSGQVHRMFPEMSTTQTILLIVALEHIMLTLRFIISCAIPDLPEWVATEMAKVEFARREAWRRLSSTTPNSGGFQGTATGTPLTPATPLNSSHDEPPGLVIGRFVVSPTSGDGEEFKEKEKVVAEEAMIPAPVSITKPEELQDPLPSPPSSPPPTGALSTSLPKLGGASSKSSKPVPREWLGAEGEALGYHLTIGPHGVDWVRGAVGRKGSQPEMGSGPSEELSTRRSTDCLAASSDSDLLRSAPPWAPAQARTKFRFSPDKDKEKPEPMPQMAAATSLSDSSRTVSSQEDEASSTQTKAEELAAKKTRVKQSLMKRARSVAIFSLKLKERRARDAQNKEAKEAQKEEKALAREAQARWGQGATNVGGELSCIPIEKLISVDDVRLDTQRRKTNL